MTPTASPIAASPAALRVPASAALAALLALALLGACSDAAAPIPAGTPDRPEAGASAASPKDPAAPSDAKAKAEAVPQQGTSPQMNALGDEFLAGPQSDREAAQEDLRELIASGEYRAADRAWRALGRPRSLGARLESAMSGFVAEARTEAQALLQDAEGPVAAHRRLRQTLRDLPSRSDARYAAVAAILELPPLRVGPPVATASGDAGFGNTTTAGTATPASNEPGARPTKPAAEATAAAELPEEEAASLAARLLEAAATLDERRYEEARTALATLRREARLALNADLLARLEREEARVAAFDHTLDTLVQAAGQAVKVGSLRLPEGGSAKLLGVRADGLMVQGVAGSGERLLAFEHLPAEAWAKLGKKLRLEGESALALASVIRDAGDLEASEAWLGSLFRREPDQLSAIHQSLAAGRGLSAVPEGAFEWGGGQWMSQREKARAEVLASINSALEELADKNATVREEAFQRLLDTGPMARRQLTRRLDQLTEELSTAIAKNTTVKALTKVASQHRELLALRTSALELIYDTHSYPYPYRPPEATAADLQRYTESQPIVDERVQAVVGLWERAKPVRIASDLRTLLDRATQMEAWRLEGDFSPASFSPAWLAFLPKGNAVSLHTFATELGERQRIDRSLRVMERELEDPSSPRPVEVELIKLTNEYRILMGRPALRGIRPLVEASHGHCLDMSNLGFFSHYSPIAGRRTPMDRARLAGAEPGGLGENLAISGSPAGAIRGWQTSPGHHRNMLSARHRLMGGGGSGRYWCQMFTRSDGTYDEIADLGLGERR